MATIPAALAIAAEHQHAGRLAEAEQIFRQVVAVEPNRAEVCCGLGLVLKLQGKLDEALACYRRALELRPDYAEAHNNLGNVLRGQGRPGEAVVCFRRAAELMPGLADTHFNLALAARELGMPDEALAALRRALHLRPAYAEAHNELGSLLSDAGRLEEAAACYRRAIQLQPGFAGAHSNLGKALRDQGKLDEALAAYRRALELDPNCAEAYSNLGTALLERKNLDEAVACYHRALALKPHLAEVHNNLGNALSDLGKLDEALACYRRALEIQPGFVMAHNNYLCALQYAAGVTPAALAHAHAEFDRSHAAPLRPENSAPKAASRTGPGRLRLGFVSPDLGRHPVGDFLVRVLENLCRQPPERRPETICYSDRIRQDAMTHRLRASATRWHDVVDLSDQQLAEQIRTDHVDVLFDLAGHTAGNRLLVFARKPAPLQITWMGYAGTTGLSAMDYLLADRWELPPAAERFYCERVLRMPDGYVCYAPPEYAPPVGPPPALRQGRVTFGSFSNPAKVTPRTVAVWSRLLQRLPGARITLRYGGWDSTAVAERYRALFAAHAIDPADVDMRGPSSHALFLGGYQDVDIALDPFPYSGGLTTCEALWMGVPVITCPGETFASRHSFSHLSNVGLTETIARNLHEYVEIAVALAHDLPRLAAIRARLRQQMAASPLCDGPRFAANLMALLSHVWQRRGAE